MSVTVTVSPGRACVTFTARDGGVSAFLMLIRGLVTIPPSRVSGMGLPVDCSAVRISATVAVDLACFRTAQAPVTWGAAMEVPPKYAYPIPMIEDLMS